MGIETAKTILAQLGGARFRMMTGARDFRAGSNSLGFRVPRAAKKITYVEIELTPDDTYTVTFRNVRRTSTRVINDVVERHTRIYAENLGSVLADATGLHTRLEGVRQPAQIGRTS